MCKNRFKSRLKRSICIALIVLLVGTYTYSNYQKAYAFTGIEEFVAAASIGGPAFAVGALLVMGAVVVATHREEVGNFICDQTNKAAETLGLTKKAIDLYWHTAATVGKVAVADPMTQIMQNVCQNFVQDAIYGNLDCIKSNLKDGDTIANANITIDDSVSPNRQLYYIFNYAFTAKLPHSPSYTDPSERIILSVIPCSINRYYKLLFCSRSAYAYTDKAYNSFVNFTQCSDVHSDDIRYIGVNDWTSILCSDSTYINYYLYDPWDNLGFRVKTFDMPLAFGAKDIASVDWDKILPVTDNIVANGAIDTWDSNWQLGTKSNSIDATDTDAQLNVKAVIDNYGDLDKACDAVTTDIDALTNVRDIADVDVKPIDATDVKPLPIDLADDLAPTIPVANTKAEEVPDVKPDEIADVVPVPVTPDSPADSYRMTLIDFFPFCIPFDLYALLGVLEAEPVAPTFTYKLFWQGEEYPTTFSLSQFDDVATALRICLDLVFCFGLAIMTNKLIKH